MGNINEFNSYVQNRVKNVLVTSIQNSNNGTHKNIGYIVVLNKKKILSQNNSKIKKNAPSFTEIDICLMESISSSLSRLLSVNDTLTSCQSEHLSYQQQTETKIKNIFTDNEKLKNNFEKITTDNEKMKKINETNSNKLHTLSETIELKEKEFTNLNAALHALQNNHQLQMDDVAQENNNVLNNTKQMCNNQFKEMSTNLNFKIKNIKKEMEKIKNLNVKYEQQIMYHVSKLEEEKTSWQEEKSESKRKHTLKLKDIDRRVRKLQQNLGIFQKRCTQSETECDVLLTKREKDNEYHEIALLQLKEEYKTQLITTSSKNKNKTDLITQMKKNVLKLRTKYEEQIQKSNLDRTNANQMLMRLETQLNEVTETLRAKNKECMEFTSQIHILEHSKHRLTSSNNELNSKINLFYENENKNKNNEMEINEIKNTNRHLESTVNMLRETLDTCRSERATLSAKISQLTPAQAASEIEIQKQMNVQISLKQELVALQKETKELTINKITTTNTITEYKRALIVSESTTDEMRIQLIQLRQLKLSLEHKMEENAIASAREIDSIKSKLMNSITKNKDNQTLINNIQSEKYKLQSNNDHIQSNVDAMTVSVTECQNKLLNERSKNQRLLNTQEEIKRTTFQQLEKIQNESLIKERNLNQTKINNQKIKESNFLEINKIKYELEKTNQDKEIMVNKLEEAVRLATTAQRQCL